jgi:Protein of unknown function (DUF3575)
MQRVAWWVFLLGTWLAASNLVHAQDADADVGVPPPSFYDDPPNLFGPEPPPPPPSHFTLSMSPIHLLIPMLEMQAEVRVLPALGVSVIGAYGRIAGLTSTGEKLDFDAYELGGQVAYYTSEDFRGLHLGVEVLYLRVDVEKTIGSERVSALGAGVTVGPMLGYKWISEPGFSVFLQGGFSVAVLKAEAKNDLGQSASDEASDIFLLLNVNLGWSF